MRIAVFCHCYPPHLGGIEVVAQNVAAQLARRHEVIVVTSAWEGNAGRTVEDGVVVHRLPTCHATERRGVPYPVPWGPGALKAMKEVGRPDLIHSHGALYVLSLLARRRALSARRPLVVTEHVGFVPYRNPLVNGAQKRAWELIGDRVVATSAAMVVCNQRVRELLKNRYPGRDVRLIPNGVDGVRFRPRSSKEKRELRQELGLPVDETLVLFAGRDVAKKNFNDVLAIPRDGFRLVVCGASRASLPEEVIDLGILPHPRMHLLYGAVDLLVHSSTGEGFPLTIQEAMASGLPGIIRWDPGYEEQISSQSVEIVHSAEELRHAVLRLVADGNRRAQLGEAAARWAREKWSWECTATAYESLFVELMGHNGGMTAAMQEPPDTAARSGDLS